MTNGEMIQKVFNCEVCEPIIEDDIIHVIFADKKDSAIGFDWSWWNAEHKEPTTKNDLSSETRKNSKKLEKDFGESDCISRKAVLNTIQDWWKTAMMADGKPTLCDSIRELPSVTPQEPQSFKWCTDCREYDQEKHCCHRWSKVIRDTVEEMKQEPKTGHCKDCKWWKDSDGVYRRGVRAESRCLINSR